MSDVLTFALLTPGGVASIADLTAHRANHRTITCAAGRNRPHPATTPPARTPSTIFRTVLTNATVKGEEQ